MLRSALCFSLLLVGSIVHAGPERTFEGRWNNRRTGSSGTMTCVASEASAGQWNAVFRGMFQGDPFEHRVTFRSQNSGNGSRLSGDATIGGKKYRWNGTLQSSQLRGRYEASNGWNGEFILNETAESRRNTPDAAVPASIEEVEIAPVIRDGDRLLFIGNEFMANQGGVNEYLAVALNKRGWDISHEAKITTGKTLKGMVNQEIGAAMMDPGVSVVVITSGDPKVMRQFATKLKDSGKRLIVFMTWEPKHPGNGMSKDRYTALTRRRVREMRALEKETGATIIPVAVLFHDLTLNPPSGMPRIDFLWQPRSPHQNAVGTMAAALMLSAMLTGESPARLNFDFPPYINGQKIADDPELRFSRDLREAIQYRAWSVAQAWVQERTSLD